MCRLLQAINKNFDSLVAGYTDACTASYKTFLYRACGIVLVFLVGLINSTTCHKKPMICNRLYCGYKDVV